MSYPEWRGISSETTKAERRPGTRRSRNKILKGAKPADLPAEMCGATRGAGVLEVVLTVARTQACATMDTPESAQSVAGASSARGTPTYGISGADSYFKVERA